MTDTKKECQKELERLRDNDVLPLVGFQMEQGKFYGSFFRIGRITSEKDFSPDLALENVYGAFRDSRLIWHLHWDGRHLNLHLGVFARERNTAKTLADSLKKTFCADFRGAVAEDVTQEAALRDLYNQNLRFSTVMGVPTRNTTAEDRKYQSVDRIIHAMADRPFHIAIIWRDAGDITDMKAKMHRIYGKIAPVAAQQGSNSTTTSEVDRKNKDISIQKSKSDNVSAVDKELLLWQKALDDELFPRMRLADAKGMRMCAIYLAAEGEESLKLLEASFTGVFQGTSPSCSPLYSRQFPDGMAVPEAIASGLFFQNSCDAGWLCLRSRLLYKSRASLATLLTPREIGFMAGMPLGDVPGLEVGPRVSFGVNIPTQPKGISLGCLLQDGGPLDVDVRLSAEDLERHVFIAGTTGAGKTTTCHRILSESGCGFLVLEPAKTEYRSLTADPHMRDMLIFTPGDERGAPFRLNPFEFMEGENISSHVDMLKACFMASFTMEAAMPNLLEEAMYRLYAQFGWDVGSNKNRILGAGTPNAWNKESRGKWFPTINDFIHILIKVIKSKHFGERLESEYIGSLRGRLESLTVGPKGRMFNTRTSLDFQWLLDQKVVIELEELKAGEDKAFVMALIVGRLLEALKIRYRKSQKPFRHILLLEEAHRLLTRLDFTDNPCRRMGVEIFTDMLAEVRKYHESLIIVDQIPSKLAPEVLKNTNTKIVHRIFADDDKRAIGETMALTAEQRDFLSRLPTGEAIIYGNGWTKPCHLRVERLDIDRREDAVEALNAARNFWEQHKTLLCPHLPGTARAKPTQGKLQQMGDISQKVHEIFMRFKDVKHEEWLELVNYALQVAGGEYAEEFLASVIEDELLRRELIASRRINFDRFAAEKNVARYAKALLSGQQKDFRKIKSFMGEGV